MKLSWTETASADALSIYAYIAERSPSYADAVYERILIRPQRLTSFPMSGSVVLEFGRSDVREVFVHSFRIIYIVLPDEIRILTVIHGARILTFIPPDSA